VFTGHSHCYERSDLLGGLYEGSGKADEHTVARPKKVRNNEDGEGGDTEGGNLEEGEQDKVVVEEGRERRGEGRRSAVRSVELGGPLSKSRGSSAESKGRGGGEWAWLGAPLTGWTEHDRVVKTDCGPLGGTMYVVAGSASQSGKGRVNHKAMRYSSKSKGSALLSIMGNSKARIDFVTEDGQVKDVVELHKNGKNCLS